MGFISDILSRTLFRSTFNGIDRLMEDIRAGKPIPKASPEPKSGTLSIEDSTLIFASADYGNWQIPISEIAAFGEYTTDNGPWSDDWFMVFVTRDFDWVEASNYCAGREEVRDHLAKRWDVESVYGPLASVTDFDSRAIWPSEIAGQPLFEFVQCPLSILDKVKSLGFGLIDKNISAEIRQRLQPTEAK